MNIRKNNDPQFYNDLKSVREVVAYVEKTSSYLKVSKKEVLREAKDVKIIYYMTDTIYVVKRMSMVII